WTPTPPQLLPSARCSRAASCPAPRCGSEAWPAARSGLHRVPATTCRLR
ncbi:MAG: hypothetical protein AVDCRST_MAG77-2678, partial [uncultured Chloroflexi bacterium]